MKHPQVIVSVLTRSRIKNAAVMVRSKRISFLALITGRALTKLCE